MRDSEGRIGENTNQCRCRLVVEMTKEREWMGGKGTGRLCMFVQLILKMMPVSMRAKQKKIEMCSGDRRLPIRNRGDSSFLNNAHLREKRNESWKWEKRVWPYPSLSLSDIYYRMEELTVTNKGLVVLFNLFRSCSSRGLMKKGEQGKYHDKISTDRHSIIMSSTRPHCYLCNWRSKNTRKLSSGHTGT